jgi:hypothetical protein
MKTIKELRDMGRDLQSKGLYPPYILLVEPSDMPYLLALPSTVRINEYPKGYILYNVYGVFEVAACEEFRFVLRERRKNQRDRRESGG